MTRSRSSSRMEQRWRQQQHHQNIRPQMVNYQMMHWANAFTLNPLKRDPLYTVYFQIKRNDLCWSSCTTVGICVQWILWVTNSHTTIGFGTHIEKEKCCVGSDELETWMKIRAKHRFALQKHFLWGGKVALLHVATFHYLITTATTAAIANIAFYTNEAR